MENQRNMDILCFGGIDWWYHNRSHFDIQMLRCCSQYGNSIYVNSIVMQKPGIRQGRKFIDRLFRKAKSICRGLKKTDEGFWVYSPLSLPVHHIGWLRPLNKMLLQFQLWLVSRKLGLRNPIVWVACPAACDVAINMKKSRLIYQRTDCFEEFPGVDVQTIKDYDQKLKATADLTLFVNRVLYEEESKQCKRALYVDHGVDFDMFASATVGEEIADEMRNLKKPIVGYFGDLDDYKLDIELIKKVVDLLPEMSFVFIGKALVDNLELISRKNVWMLGHKPYEQIADYGKCFDVATLPWRQSCWNKACNPIKLKEYLALGKPVVSTSAFSEIQKYLDVSYVADTPEEFAKCVLKALNEDSPERIAARRKKVKKATWDNKAQIVLEELFDNNELSAKKR